MYNQKLVVCIKTAGKILKEFNKDQVRVPFGSEYSIYLKNLNSVRALVHISIDGKSVDDNSGFVVHPNESVDIERFIKNGNLTKGNCFKFIERSAKVEAHRGVEAEDGIIRVEFQFEKQTIINEIIEKYKIIKEKEYVPYYPWSWPSYPPYKKGHWEWKDDIYSCPTWYGSPSIGQMGIAHGLSNTLGLASGSTITTTLTSTSTPDVTAVNYAIGGASDYSINCISQNSLGDTSPVKLTSSDISGQSRVLKSNAVLRSEAAEPVVENDIGITVEGSVSDQKFHTAAWFDVESTKHVVVLKLIGATESGAVKKAVTVKTKQTCKTCGTRNRGQNKHCRECGTSLEIV